MTSPVVGERLQKFLASQGLGSRREIESWIKAGRLTVNGKPAELGVRVQPRDRIQLDGRPLNARDDQPAPSRVLLYHKPVGEICTRHDPQGRPDVFARLPRLRHGRWLLVGRLDINTSGLLLLTNEGELAHRLMHPANQIEREYAVRVRGEVDDEILRNLRRGVLLDDGMASFKEIRDAGGRGSNHWYHVILNEGRNREVRRLWESQGLQVSRLTRVRYGDITLTRGLEQGDFRELADDELATLFASVGLQPVVKASLAESSVKKGRGRARSADRKPRAGQRAPARRAGRPAPAGGGRKGGRGAGSKRRGR